MITDETRIHPTAVIEPGARLDASVVVGPYAVIEAGVSIGPGCHVGAHAVIQGETRLGAGNHIGVHAVVGGRAQIRDAEGSGRLVLGDHNCLRELSTVHCGSPGQTTRLGHANFLMVGSHVAHDCQLGDNIEIANGVQLAGHVEVGDHATLGGLCAVHQFARVGAHALVGAGAMVSRDVPPFSLVSGDRARCYGINAVGLRRRGFSAELRRELDRVLKLLLSTASPRQAREQLWAGDNPPPVEQLLRFAESSRRGLCALANDTER